ncbi:DUF481 domain-containing protein [Marinimicrobium alkaliphilum]|uniref:DUF481 domain-containing protein n=1 Tax=Marinimicrobium alkaliphilum TaxID=2202654 RepID=UPI000DBAD599|nr:DUF481 domain-containing protein [Marinimicrobium alkaliphilum]
MKYKTLMTGALAVAGAAISSSAAAEDRDSPWTASAEFGALITSGNTETTSFNGRFNAEQDLERWQNQYQVSARFKEDVITLPDGERSTEKTAERYYLSARSGYKLTEDYKSLFVYGSYTDDQFGSYVEYTTVAVGYSDRLVDSERHRFDYEVGPGYFRARAALGDGLYQTEEGALLRAGVNYRWVISETATFRQTLAVESGEDNTRTTSDTSVSARINNSMQMRVGFEAQRNSDVAPGKENTDTTTYANLVYTF